MLNRDWLVSNRGILLVLLLGALVLLPALSFGLWEPWEPKYAQSAVEMIERGDYVTPYYRGVPRYSKPILTYWVIASSYAVFGVNEFATRLPFVLFALSSIGVFVHCLTRLFSRTLGTLGGIILLTSPMFYLMSRQAMPDVLFVACLTMALCFLALGLFEDEACSRRMLLFYVFAALAVLAKGPLALILVGTIVGLYVLLTLDFATGSWRGALKNLGTLLFRRMKVHWGIPLFLLITVPWYAYHLLAHETFLERLRYDYLTRFLQAEGHHDGSVTYYIEKLVYGLFPWTALVGAAALCIRPQPQTGRDHLRRKQLFFVCWFICPFLMFSAAATKFSYYIAPVLPPLAVLAAASLSTYLKDSSCRARSFALPILAVGVFLLPARALLADPGFLVGTITIKRSVNQVSLADPSFPHPQMTHLVMFGLFAAILLVLAVVSYWKVRKYAVAGLCAVAVVLGAYNAQYLIVNLSPHKSQKQVVANVKTMMDPDDELAIFFPGKDVQVRRERSAIESSAVFYTNDNIVELNSLEQAREYFKGAGHGYCIVRKRHMRALNTLFKELGLTMNVVDMSHYRFTTIEVRRSSSRPVSQLGRSIMPLLGSATTVEEPAV